MASMSFPLLCSACVSLLGRSCRLLSSVVPLLSGLVAFSMFCCRLVPHIGRCRCIFPTARYLISGWAFLT